MRLALAYLRVKAFRRTCTVTRQVERRVWLPRRPMHGVFTKKKKKFIFHTRELEYNFFFTNLKLRVHNTCVEFFFSRVCRTHKIFQLCIKLLLKLFFCKFFCLVYSKDIFIPFMKFSLNYQLQYFLVPKLKTSKK